jgi:capsular exopolysaccharide synthesis family protein
MMDDDAPRLTLDRPSRREQPHLRDYLQVLGRRWFTVAFVFTAVMAAAAFYTLSQTAVYEARARLIVEPIAPVAGAAVTAQDLTGVRPEDLQTHYQLLQSRSLARDTINELGAWERFLPSDEGRLRDDERAQARAVSAFLRNLKVSPVQDSRLIEVSFRHSDPALAARAVNALATAYIAENVDSKTSAIRDTSDFLDRQIAEQRKQVAAAEAALQNYRERNDALSLETGQNIVVQKLADLNAAVTKAKTERVQREAIYRQATAAGNDPQGLDSVPAVVINTFVQQQRAELAALQRQQAQLSERLGDKHPEMAKVKLAIETAERRVRAAVDEVVQSLRRDYAAAVAQEESLTSALNQQKAIAQSMNRKGIAYAVLQRDVESSKQVYDSLLERARMTVVSSDAKTSNVRIVDAAAEPDVPLGPGRMQVVLLALVGGVFLAVSAAFFLEYLDNRVRTPEAVEAHLRLLPLGLIPRQPRRHRVGRRLIDYTRPTPLVEAFRALRTNVMFSSSEEPHSIVVTSASPGEGKTLIAANLALGLAQAGQRVVIVDADLRRPHMHQLFGLPCTPGLSDVLVGGARLQDGVRHTDTPSLRVLTAGDPATNPAELVGSPRFAKVLSELQRNFDVVVVDSPPVMAVADASILAHQTSGVLFVVAADSTSRHAARAALDQLQRARGRFLGAVLNRTDGRMHRYYRSSYSGRDHRRIVAGA